MENFQIIKELGAGSFGKVYKAMRKCDQKLYAIKKVSLLGLNLKERQNALNEVRILASIENSSVVGYKESFYEESTNSLCIVLEFADGGDLMQKIDSHKKNKTTMSERQIWDYFVQMLQGIESLHQSGIVHRDLKAANVFLTSQDKIKLGDLNVSKVLQTGKMMHTQTGTPYYACPEVWQDKAYDSRSDIWSLGCILYEICALRPPFMAKDMRGLYNKVLKGVYPSISAHYSDDLKSVIAMCLQVDPSKRPTSSQLLRKREVVLRLNRDDPPQINVNQSQSLLDTIRCPANMNLISDVLPKSNYRLHTRREKARKLGSLSTDRSALKSARENRSIDSARFDP